MWLRGVVVREPDMRSTGRGFDSRPPGYRLCNCSRRCASVTKQYQAVQFGTGQWAVMLCGWAGRRARAWRKLTAAHRRVYGFGHLLVGCPDQLRKPTLVSSMRLPVPAGHLTLQLVDRLSVVRSCVRRSYLENHARYTGPKLQRNINPKYESTSITLSRSHTPRQGR